MPRPPSPDVTPVTPALPRNWPVPKDDRGTAFVLGGARTVPGVSVVFHDVTTSQRLLAELANANRLRENAYAELQSTTEELETTNEELQSTVEELETANEELRSTNEELETTNEELRGLRSDETEGEHLLNLDIGLPVAELRPVARPALADPSYSKDIVLEAVNRRGRPVTVRISCGALRNRRGDSTGAILVLETVSAVSQAATEGISGKTTPGRP